DQNDALASWSNYGGSVFLAAPGVGIKSTYPGSSYVTLDGTSASAAIVAGSAALMRAVDSTLSNGVVVDRLAESADAAGTQDQTGNGRVNLQRAISDTSTTSIEPAGTAPVGNGGPFVGPYKAGTVNNITVSFPANNGFYNSSGYSSGGGNINGTVVWDGTDSGRGVSVSIKRLSDSQFWNGTSFSSSSEVFNAAAGSFSGNGQKAWSYTFSLPSDGQYAVRAQATQTGATTVQSATNTFTIDNT